MTTIQTPKAVLTVAFSPDFMDASPRTFTLTTEQGETWYQGPFLNENDVISGLAEALGQGQDFLVSDKGVFATHGGSEVRVFCGGHAAVLSGCVDGWWALLTEAPERINDLYEAVVQQGLIPSTFAPGLVYLADPEEGGWLRTLSLDDLPMIHREASAGFDDYSGRCLVCPEDHALRVVELCAEPGSYYGPYRVMSAHHQERYQPVHESSTMEEAKAVALEMAKHGAPEPLPAWRDDSMKVVKMPHGFTGVMYPHFSSGMDIWIEEYFVDILDHNGRYLTTMSLDENMGELIAYRDNPEKFLGYLAKECPEADLSDRGDQWSAIPVYPEFPTLYADEPQPETREVEAGGGLRLLIYAPVRKNGIKVRRADLHLTENVTLHIKRFDGYGGAYQELSIEAYVRTEAGETDTVRVPTQAQHLGPVVQQVLSGKISEQTVLEGLERMNEFREKEANAKEEFRF